MSELTVDIVTSNDGRAVDFPDGVTVAGQTIAGDYFKSQTIAVALGTEHFPSEVGDKTTFRATRDMYNVSLRASLSEAQATGVKLTVDIKTDGVSILSTPITFENGERTTKTATVQPMLAVTSILDDQELEVVVTQVGDNTATGLKVYFICL